MNTKKDTKNCKIDIRCTQSEKASIIEMAGKKNMSPADYVRSRALMNERKKGNREKDRKAVEELVNLNKSVNEFEDYLFSVLPEELIYQTGIVTELNKIKKETVKVWDNCLS